MALKPFNELIQVDVRKFCDLRDAKDENGKTIKVPYLSWGKCLKLLHENGANDVWYAPVECPTTHTYLWPQATVSTSKGRDTDCWFVRVLIHIDELEFVYDTPLLNGSLVVYTDTLNQLRINNALARAFVKGVAVRTGLGFDLWAESDTDDGEDDLSRHNIWAIKERIERLITVKEQNGLDHSDLLRGVGIGDRELNKLMGYFSTIDKFEKAVSRL
nr:MAG TPA: Protein of unknown function (DUF1071) [Caudoviricetes sp.]